MIIDNAEMKAKYARDVYGIKITKSAFLRGEAVGHGPNQLSPKQYRKLKSAIYWHTKTAVPMMVTVPGAIRSMKVLKRWGCDLAIITSSSAKQAKISRDHYQEKGLKDVPVVGVGMDNNDKSKAAMELDLDFFVDDHLEKLLPLRKKVPHLFHYQPHGSKPHAHVDGIEIVTSWDDIKVKVLEILINRKFKHQSLNK